MHYDRPNLPPTDLSQLAERFRRFADTEVEETSPLYHRLALMVAADPDLLALAAHAQPGQPPANMLLGVVHYLLLQNPAHELAHCFPDLTPAPRTADAAVFRAFCLTHGDAIASLLRTRLVQTNELRRCAYLLPAFSHIAALVRQPLALIEVGASAGLNLLFDRYAYRYTLDGAAASAGKPDSTVVIEAACRQQPGAQLPLALPAIAHRVGIDLNPVDLRDDDAYSWLRALIWPEHDDRVQRLHAARQLWLTQPPLLLRGDAVTTLPGVLASLPAEVAPVIFHTHVLNQFTPDAAAALEAVIRHHAARRPIYRFGNDLGGGDPKQYVLRLRLYAGDAMQEHILGYAEGHARQIEWCAVPHD